MVQQVVKEKVCEQKVVEEEYYSEEEEDSHVLPIISATQVLVYDLKSKKTLHAYNEHQKVQMASLTKMMTCLTVIRLCDKFSLNYETERVTVSSKAS